MSDFFHQNNGQDVTTATRRTSTPQLLKRRKSHKKKTDVCPQRTYVQLLITDQGFNRQ